MSTRHIGWRDLYPEGSTVFVNGLSFNAKHNPNGSGIDLYTDGVFALTIAPDFIPWIASSVKYPELRA